MLHLIHALQASVVLYLFPTSLASIGPVARLTVANKNIKPDGFTRPTVLGNGQFPGPLIKGKKGDHFSINVIDKLTNETMLTDTSIHWHGIFQKRTNWADGTASVTQCPISPNHSFLYSFDVQNQAGTFWWHSHLSMQYCDGLRGPLVVYDPHDPHKVLYDIDNDATVITLADWYHVGGGDRGHVPPDSVLINGRGRFMGGPMSPLSVVNVIHGKRYRFRLVSISCDPGFLFSIDQHNLTVIEADGISTQPLVVDSIEIFSGQRYSFVVNATNKVDNYWIRALPEGHPQDFEGGMNSAILRYRGAKKTDPKTQQSPSVHPLQETNLHPLDSPGAPGRPEVGGVDVSLNLKIDVDHGDHHEGFTINGASFMPPSVPVLLQILSGARNATQLLPNGSVYPIPPNKIVEVSIPGGSVGSPHPFHLHGHAFDVVRSANSSQYNYINPVRRDTVNTGFRGDNVTVRFRTDNAGPWFLHCHIDHHLEGGMAIVFAEDAEDTSVQNPVPAAWNDLCPTFNSLQKSD